MEFKVCHTQFISSVWHPIEWHTHPHVSTQPHTYWWILEHHHLTGFFQKSIETHSKWTHTHTHRLRPSSLRRQISWAVADIMYLACHTDVTAMLLTLPESAVKYEWQSQQWIPPSATVSGPSHPPPMNYWDKWLSQAFTLLYVCVCGDPQLVRGYITPLWIKDFKQTWKQEETTLCHVWKYVLNLYVRDRITEGGMEEISKAKKHFSPVLSGLKFSWALKFSSEIHLYSDEPINLFML